MGGALSEPRTGGMRPRRIGAVGERTRRAPDALTLSDVTAGETCG